LEILWLRGRYTNKKVVFLLNFLVVGIGKRNGRRFDSPPEGGHAKLVAGYF
jgi:hypothetical protein